MPAADGVEVELLVQVVRDGEVEDVEVGVAEQLVAVVGEQAHGVDALEPRAGLGARVADGLEPRRDRVVVERGPAPDRRRQLAAHQAAADDADPGDAHCQARERLVDRRAVVHDRHQRPRSSPPGPRAG